MKKLNNKNKEFLKDRKLCTLLRQGNRIVFKIGPNTTLTAFRNFIKTNSLKIKNIQKEIRHETKVKLTERTRDRSNRWRDWIIFNYSKETISELRKLIKDPEERKLSENIKYKAMIIAKIWNQDLQTTDFLGETIDPEEITDDNVRKIISRQKRLFLQGKI